MKIFKQRYLPLSIASASNEYLVALSTPIVFVKKILGLFCCLSCFMPILANAEWVEWIGEGSVDIETNDNLNRSGFSSDMEEDTAIIVKGAIGRVNQVSGTFRYSVTADLRADIFDEYDMLSSKSVGTTLTLRKKLGLGLTVPWVKGSVQAFYLDVKDDIRSGANIIGDVQIGKRYSERLDVVAGFRLKTRNGKSAPSASPPIGGNVFDQDAWEVYLSSSYLLTERLLSSFGLAYFDGEIDSACTPQNVGTVIANETLKGIVADNVFGGCVYRLDLEAYTYSLGASYALDNHSSINFSYRYQDGDTSYQSYKNTVYGLSYKYSY